MSVSTSISELDSTPAITSTSSMNCHSDFEPNWKTYFGGDAPPDPFKGRNYMFESKLHNWCWTANIDEVKRMFEKHGGKNLVSLREKGGLTPLHCACKGGSLEVVKFLVDTIWFDDTINTDDSNVSVSNILNATDDYGITPLFIACGECYQTCALYLLGNSMISFLMYPSVMSKGHDNRTILHQACFRGHVDLIQEILSHPRAQDIVNVQDDSGRTVLHYAAVYFRTVGVFRLLFNYPYTNPTLKTYSRNPLKRRTALDFLKDRKGERDHELENLVKLRMKEPFFNRNSLKANVKRLI
jgi:ankyrin repeat protein